MKRKKYNPYGIDLKYELETFKHVGADYRNSKIVPQNSIGNIVGKKKKYEYCNTYSEWERHVRESINKDIQNPKDLLRWLYMLRRNSQRNLEIVKVIFIPVYITMLAACLALVDQYADGVIGKVVIAGLSLIAAAISLDWYLYEDTWINFYDDFIKVVEDEFDL